MTYVIKCCNCYFDMYLLEINQRPELIDSEKKKTGLIDIIRIRHRRTKRKAKKWAMAMVSYRWWINISFAFWMYLSSIAKFNIKNSLILEVLKKSVLWVSFGLYLVLDLSKYNFDRNLYIYSGFFCHFCQEHLFFHVINNYFNFIDRSFILKW